MEPTTIKLKENAHLNDADVLHLYSNAEWVAYTKDPNKLFRAIKNSLYVLTAWETSMENEEETLVSLLRCIGDGESILYIQDIIVVDTHRRRGIGTQMVQHTCKRFSNIRQKVLLTDNTKQTRAFYNSVGFMQSDELGLMSFVQIS